MDVGHLQTGMLQDFCRAIVGHFGDRIERQFADDDLLAAMFFYVAGIPKRTNQPTLTEDQEDMAKILLGAQ